MCPNIPLVLDMDIQNDNIIEDSTDVNVTSHLNETENWRGKNNKSNCRKYLINCPDIESIHQKPNLLIHYHY